MYSDRYEKEIKDAIRTLAKEFCRNPSGFKSKSDFKERFYSICLGKRPFKERDELSPMRGKKLSVVKKDCPIYFSDKENDKILERSCDIAILSEDLITRFMFDLQWHMSLLKNDAAGLIAVIEFVFITEHSDRVKTEVESCYAKLDLVHHLAGRYIIAFSTSHEGNDHYFKRTIDDPGSPAEPDIICISLEQEENGKKSIKYEQHPLPWITTSKFKDRMERLDYFMFENFWRKWYDWKRNRLERKYMPHIIDAVKKNRVVGVTGHTAVDRMVFGWTRFDAIFGKRVLWLNSECYEAGRGDECLEVIGHAFRSGSGLSLDERIRLNEEFDSRMKRLSLEEKQRLLRESVPDEKGLIIFHNVTDDALIRQVLACMGHWHALVISRKPVAVDLIDVSIDIGGRRKRPGLIAKYLSKYLFGENRW